MINGYKGNSIKFLGLVPLQTTLTNLGNDMSKFASVSSNIQSINNLALGTKGQNLIDSISSIQTAVTGVTTLDANSTNSTS